MEDQIILIDKPSGISSFGCVAKVRGRLKAEFGHKVKVGHTGTLDPFATGLLILLSGKMTKKSNEFLKKDKEYIATMKLGFTSTTGDPEGEIQPYPARAAALRNAPNQNANSHYIILCPHYEGYDERILSIVDYKISLGKYVLTGGELPALIIIDSVVRLIPGVLGGEQSAEIESFSDGDNLEYPQYTRPEEFRGMKVPEVLLSGNHGEIAKWREEHSGTV